MDFKIISHRGARGLAPENTGAAIRKGLQHTRPKIDMIEFDVRVTRDHVPILHHDAECIDGGGEKLLIRAHTFSELKAHFPDITTLKEAFLMIQARAIAYIEVKPGEDVGPICDVIQHFLGDTYRNDDVRLASMSQKTLRELHAALPDVPKIVIESWSGVRAHKRAKDVGALEIAMNARWLWWGFIRGFKHSKYSLYTYTLNSPDKVHRWAKWGLAGVVTDYPDRFEQ